MTLSVMMEREQRPLSAWPIVIRTWTHPTVDKPQHYQLLLTNGSSGGGSVRTWVMLPQCNEAVVTYVYWFYYDCFYATYLSFYKIHCVNRWNAEFSNTYLLWRRECVGLLTLYLHYMKGYAVAAMRKYIDWWTVCFGDCLNRFFLLS